VNATQRFYTGFFVALAIVVGLSYGLGYRAGESHAGHEVRAGAAP
jgi:hypothetical protein